MRFFCGKNKGAISVFLTLILVPVLIFSGIIVDASRLFASKTVVSGAGDLAMNAALSKYDKELKDSYGLFAMADRPDSQQTKENLEKYFKESCNSSYLETENSDDIHFMIQLELGDGGINANGVASSSLANSHVLKQQIVEYMKFRGPVYIVTDILEKFKKLPLENMDEKKEYVEAKSDYGKEASKLGDPLKNAKEYVEQHRSATEAVKSSVKEGFSGEIQQFQEKSAFWLAARSLENYLNGTTIAPIGSGEISIDTVKNNLAGCIVWNEGQSTFSDSVYADLIAAVSLYQLRSSLDSQMTEENGFTQDEVEKYRNIEPTIRQSILNMDKIYDSAAKEYKQRIEAFEQEADFIIDSGNNAIDQLEKLIKIWEKDVQPAMDECNEKEQVLKNKGEDTSVIETEWKNESLNINKEDAEHLILVLENNIQEAKNSIEQLEQLKQIPDNLRNQNVSSDEGKFLLNYGYKNGINQYWNDHQIENGITVSVIFQDVFQEKFYKDVLFNAGEGTENENNRNEKERNEKEAKESQDEYGYILEGLENAQNEKLLEDYEGLSYPSEFPSGLENIFSDISSSKKVNKIDVTGDEVSDVVNASGSMGNIGQLLNSLDNVTGELLERAYLMEYITEMFNCLTTKEGEKSLSNMNLSEHYIYNGEIEYILYGNSNTAVNKLSAVGTLFSLRLAINSIYVFFNKNINAEAEAVATGISTATGQAWLYPIVKYSYMFCRAIIMSGQDIVQLVKGNEVVVWPDNKKITLSYKEYMKLFILIAFIGNDGEKKLISRTGDCIQLNTGENLSEKFTMLTLEAEVESTVFFLPKVPAILGGEQGDGKKTIRYKGVLAY